jgi:capsular polysaccharide biosynthesis protein
VGANGQPTRDMKTQSEIATSDDVLTGAAASLHPSPTPQSLVRRIRVHAASEDVLVIAASGSSSKQAVAMANAVSNAFVAFSTSTASSQANSVTAALAERVSQLTSQISRLQAEIATGTTLQATFPPGSAEAAHESSVLAALQTEETDAAAQLNNVNNQIDNTRLSQVLTGAGMRVIDPATTAVHSSRVHTLLPLALGALVGLIGGCLVALQLDQRDRRMRCRDDIADAIGVPVLASLNAPRRAGPREIGELLERPDPSAVDAWNLRRALRYLGAGEGDIRLGLAVVSLPDDPAAVLVGPIIARFAASVSIPTTLVVSTHDRVAAPLRAAAHSFHSTNPNMHFIDSDDLDGVGNDARLLVAVGVHKAGEASPDGIQALRATILAVSSNVATADQLAELAIAAADADRPVIGIVVANPEIDDTTTGRFPQPARPATAIPRRVTGTTKDTA